MILTSNNEQRLKAEMYKIISEQLRDLRSGKSTAKRVVMIVPAQATLITEEDGFKYLGGEGFFDFLVMSGARFRTEVLKETGGPGRTVINTLGRSMLLRKILRDESEEMSVFKGVAKDPGFIDLAADLIVQMKQNNVSPDGLEALCDSLGKETILSSKLSDMRIIYSDYQAALADKYTDSEDLLLYTTGKLRESSFVRDSIIWYYGFYSFTKREYDYLEELAACSSGFNIALLADEKRYLAGRRTAESLGARLETEIVRIDGIAPEQKTRVVGCASVYTQSQTIACDILKKLRDEGAGYGDFLVLAQDEDMQQSLCRIMESLGIPVFMDKKRGMQHSAPALYISYLLAAANGLRQRDVLGLAKSGIPDISDDALCDFVNYVIQYKIHRTAFLEPFKYGEKDPKYPNAESVRAVLGEMLATFIDEFNAAKTVREKSGVLYGFLTEKADLPGRMEALAKEYEEKGYLEAAQENAQSWDVFVSLLDQMVELLGDEITESDEYSALLTSCFADVKLGVLPQAFGKVSVGSVTRSSFSEIKYLYVAGFNDGIIPSDKSADGILTEREIERLAAMDLSLVKNSEVYSEEELFQVERVLDTPCREMVLLWCASNGNGETMMMSPMLADIIKEKKLIAEDDLSTERGELEYIQSPSSAAVKMTQKLKDYLLGEEISPEWKETANLLAERPEMRDAVAGLFFDPGENRIDADIAERLYKKGGRSYLSASQLESFAQCPFKHFVNYGLGPDEQRSFETSGLETGSAVHEVLEILSKRLLQQTRDAGLEICDPSSPWMTVTKDGIRGMVEEILEELAETYPVMNSTPEEQYRKGRLCDMASAFAEYMIIQLRKGRLSKMYFETKFGADGQLPALEVETPFGKARIEGKIDRTDIINTDGREFVKIIDYKSGSKDFSLDKVQAGLELQLMVYLEAVMAEGKGREAGGVFYYLVRVPELDAAFESVIADEITEDIEKKLSAYYSLDGIALKDEALLESLDSQIAKGDKLTTDVFKGKSGRALLSAEEMSGLRDGFKLTLERLCTDIQSGNADIHPAVYKRQNAACSFCQFSSICERELAL